jgi:uroporphyrin-III C-methyltransferase / precorrin-2 dehydrogenase / sirohydrochlorin ferrochelatase
MDDVVERGFEPAPRGGRVSLVGAGPGDPELWTVRALKRVEEADLVLYDALVDAEALRRLTDSPCFCVGKRAGRASVRQETINRLMIRAARQGKHVVRLKGGDPFVFGRGAEEALALAMEGIPFEVVPGVTTAVAAPELAGIPVTHRGVASAFLVLAGQTGDALEATLGAIRPQSVTLVSMMGLGGRGELASRLIAHGWSAETRAAIVCGASTPDAWTWTGRLEELESVAPPEGVPGVVVVGEVVQVRDALEAAARVPEDGHDAEAVAADEVKYGR